MLLGEFAKITGFRPDYDYYRQYIKPYYIKSGLSKQEWCEQWVNNGGIQKAYNYMRQNRNDYKVSLYDVQEWLGKCIGERDDYKRKIESSKNALDAVIEKLSYLFDQCKSEQDDLSALITKLIEVKISQS